MLLRATLLLLICGGGVNEVCEDCSELIVKNFDSLRDLLAGDGHHMI